MSKILIIDDDTFICEILKKQLTSNGYQVETAFSGRKGMEAVKSKTFDLVLCDFRLPDTDGLELLQRIKAISRSTIVIIITAYADVRQAVKLMKMGAEDYITKPLQHEEILALVKQKLTDEKKESAQADDHIYTDGDFVMGKSDNMRSVINLSRRVAPTNMSVLIQGETGTGKEYIARFIHQHSKRNNKPFVALDCGAIPKDLANSELFGHIKGSFTGAVRDKEGVFQQANGGTLFLDEIGNLTYDIQVRLLRVLQERTVSRVGENKSQKVDVRIITATNDDLLDEVSQNRFREDLYHRVNEFKINLPSLRERREDILFFANHFLQASNDELGLQVEQIAPDAELILQKYPWHGNLRELKNVIKRATLLSGGTEITKDCLPRDIVYPSESEVKSETVEIGESKLKDASSEFEKQLILRTIEEAGYNKSKAARLLKIDRKTLYNKIKQYGIEI
ncbi:sigma-54-dependent transcriptional regulator [uncultured Sunxiuqinia sp.]|uniref:sigma-54-dependent transcriptional regulator n=1 Tax=Sunxiuqinia rutila TaxID=1397841 RepID=UPI0026120CF8|nr:sigma-54 dependent transcriptional regulator [uncultured Sunxiuqinia sp.]